MRGQDRRSILILGIAGGALREIAIRGDTIIVGPLSVEPHQGGGMAALSYTLADGRSSIWRR